MSNAIQIDAFDTLKNVDVFLAFLQMKCDTPYPTLFKWGEFADSCEGISLKPGMISWKKTFW